MTCVDFLASFGIFVDALPVFVAARVQAETSHALRKGSRPVELLQGADLDGSSSGLFTLSYIFVKICRVFSWHRNLNSTSGPRTVTFLPITRHSVIHKCLRLLLLLLRVD